ncbi:MAG: hypothetical protein WAZ94_08410 [Phycisphaerales bacterium]
MTPQQFELKVLEAVDRVLSGVRTEDSFWELKREWPPTAERTARRIAAHANSARGGMIAWIIGLDEKDRAVIGTEPPEFATWWQQLQSHFEGGAPKLVHHCASGVQDKTVVGLLFDCREAPYVVWNPKRNEGSEIELEVPWREGTRTRTARRADLLRILVPAASMPEITLLRARAHLGAARQARTGRHQGLHGHECWVGVSVFVERQDRTEITLPLHLVEGTLSIRGWDRMLVDLTCDGSRTMHLNEALMPTVHVSSSAAVFPGSSGIELQMRGFCPDLPGVPHQWLQLQMKFSFVAAPHPVVVEGELSPHLSDPSDESARGPTWEYDFRAARRPT